MKGVHGLIRLHRWQLDEKRRRLVDLQSLQDELEGQLARLEAEIKAEQRTAAADAAAFAYGTYAQAAVLRRGKIAQSMTEVGLQLSAAREEVSEAFQELKKFELMQEQRERRTRAATERRLVIEQDELGLSGFRRRQAEQR